MATIGESHYPAGNFSKHFTGTITYASASNTALFTLPPWTTILSARILGTVVSNAGTNARISIGCNTNEYVFLSQYNVKTNGNLQAYPSSFTMLGALNNPNPVYVIGRYDEVGTAGTVGSWVVDFEVL